MLISNVPQIEFTETGIVVPQSQEVLNGVLADINQAFNFNLSLNLDTPQGQLATSIAAIINNKNAQIAYLVNQFDPRYASGFFQDALGEIYFIIRKEGTPTIVDVTVTGIAGTIIPAGTLVKDISNNTYAFTNSVQIGLSGTQNGQVENIVNGPIPCPAATLNVIFQSVIGWDTINNSSDGVVGTEVENRQQFEQRRFESVQKNSRGSLDAILGGILSINNVLDALVIENTLDISDTVLGVLLVPHSIFVSVYALNWINSLQTEVAQTIFNLKAPGCAYNGSTTIPVIFQGITYNVQFQEAIPTQIYFKIQISNNVNLPGNIVTLIQNSIVNAFDESIGSLIEANKYYGAILSVNPIIQIISVFVGGTPSPVTISFQTNADEKPLTSQNNIIVELI